MRTKRLEKQQTSIKVLSFGKSTVYQIYNHLALGHTALMLGDYKSDIALVGVL